MYVVANKVRSERNEMTIREYSARLGMDMLGLVPFDEAAQTGSVDGVLVYPAREHSA